MSTFSLEMPRLEWLEEAGLGEWDAFQMSNPRGHYCQLSTWLKSFECFGGQERVLVARDESGAIVGGLGCIAWQKWGVDFWTAPAGPVVRDGSEQAAGPILTAACAAAQGAGAMVLIVQPIVSEVASRFAPMLLPSAHRPTHDDLAMRLRLPGMAVGEMMWIDFSRALGVSSWEENLLATFSQNTRRDIRSSLRSDLVCISPQEPEQMRAVYGVIEANGRAQGYATRTWEEFGRTIVEQVGKGHATLLGVLSEDRLVGAHYGVLAGQRLSYMMGGTIRVGGSLKIGHFVQWMAIKRAYELGLAGYDLTSFGTPGVNRFKMGFNPQVIRLIPAQQVVFRDKRYGAWIRLLPTVQRHARLFAALMRRSD